MITKTEKKESVTKILNDLERLVHKAIEGDIIGERFTAFELILISLDTIKEEYEKPNNVLQFVGNS